LRPVHGGTPSISPDDRDEPCQASRGFAVLHTLDVGRHPNISASDASPGGVGGTLPFELQRRRVDQGFTVRPAAFSDGCRVALATLCLMHS